MGNAIRCLQDAPSSQDVLRVFDANRAAASGPHGITSRLTVKEFWESYVKPVHLVMLDARPRKIESTEESVAYWVRFTGDPPIDEISVFHSRDYFVGLKGLPGRKYATMANNTIRKHAGAIQAVLDLMGPPSRTNREALGLMQAVPYLARPPKEDKPAEDCYVLEELRRLVENADAAIQPKKINGRPIKPGTYYRRIYALIFNTGIRIQGVITATWKNYHDEGESPYLWLPPRVSVKGRVGKRVELNDQARDVIEAMRGYDAERIFPWPRSYEGSRHNLYSRGHDLIRQCLPEHRRKHFAFHALRKLHNNELAAINGLACMKSLGHSTGRTTVESYTSTRVVAAAVAKLPHVQLGGESQRRLFE